MAALSEHSNVYNTAIELLRQRGYQRWYDADTDDFCAEGGMGLQVTVPVRIARAHCHSRKQAAACIQGILVER